MRVGWPQIMFSKIIVLQWDLETGNDVQRQLFPGLVPLGNTMKKANQFLFLNEPEANWEPMKQCQNWEDDVSQYYQVNVVFSTADKLQIWPFNPSHFFCISISIRLVHVLTIHARTCTDSHACTPTVQPHAPPAVSPSGLSLGLSLAICVKVKIIATRMTETADVKTRLSADQAKLCLRTAPEGGTWCWARSSWYGLSWFITLPTTCCLFLSSVCRKESLLQQTGNSLARTPFLRVQHLSLKCYEFEKEL